MSTDIQTILTAYDPFADNVDESDDEPVVEFLMDEEDFEEDSDEDWVMAPTDIEMVRLSNWQVILLMGHELQRPVPELTASHCFGLIRLPSNKIRRPRLSPLLLPHLNSLLMSMVTALLYVCAERNMNCFRIVIPVNTCCLLPSTSSSVC